MGNNDKPFSLNELMYVGFILVPVFWGLTLGITILFGDVAYGAVASMTWFVLNMLYFTFHKPDKQSKSKKPKHTLYYG